MLLIFELILTSNRPIPVFLSTYSVTPSIVQIVFCKIYPKNHLISYHEQSIFVRYFFTVTFCTSYYGGSNVYHTIIVLLMFANTSVNLLLSQWILVFWIFDILILITFKIQKCNLTQISLETLATSSRSCVRFTGIHSWKTYLRWQQSSSLEI